MGRTARRITLGAAACSVLVAAACSTSTNGKGTTGQRPSTPSSGGATGRGGTGFPSAPASSGPGASGATCAGYCDDFSSTSTGWTVENKPHYFAGYDNYLGGTYRVGERTDNTVSEPAPIDITTVSSDYSVQVEVDAVLATTMPAASGFGVSCWEHDSKDGSSTSAFVFLVTAAKTSIGIWSDVDGTYHDIVTKKTPGLLRGAGTTNHLTVTCVQGAAGGSAEAQLGITVNGAPAAAATYAKSLKTYQWAVGPHIGLLASGKGSDIFYDNFAVTSKCQGASC